MSNSFKIRFVFEPQFFVNEDNKTVTCKLDAVLDNCVMNILSDDALMAFDNHLSATAIAKCSPNDAFDIDRGKRIAMARAENQIYRQAHSRMQRWVKIFTRLATKSAQSGNKFMDYSYHNDEYIQTISDSRHPVNPLKRGSTKIVSKKK